MTNKIQTLWKVSILALILSLILNGCSHTTTAPALIPPAPKQSESVVPHMQKVNRDIDNTIKTNVKLSEKLTSQKQSINDQRLAIVEALTQAEKMKTTIKANGVVTELDTNNLIIELKHAQDRNMFLETSNAELITLKTEQEKTLDTLKQDGEDTLSKLYVFQDETLILRGQNKWLGGSLILKNKETETLKLDLSKEKEKSAKSGVYKHWVIGLVAGFLLWTIIKNVLMVYLPTTRFRI